MLEIIIVGQHFLKYPYDESELTGKFIFILLRVTREDYAATDTQMKFPIDAKQEYLYVYRIVSNISPLGVSNICKILLQALFSSDTSHTNYMS